MQYNIHLLFWVMSVVLLRSTKPAAKIGDRILSNKVLWQLLYWKCIFRPQHLFAFKVSTMCVAAA